MSIKICPTCGGNGIVRALTEQGFCLCKTCKGTGKIVIDDPIIEKKIYRRR